MNSSYMNPWDVIWRLYASEINAGMQTFWDGGVTVWIGDPSNGICSQATFLQEEFGLAGEWLDREARKHFPHSEYAAKQ